ncbi:hypothetical protein EHQ46_05955 [Leptospira yanagawae]|uniref:Uncharacterized protein n=1 Tax=Leptospira yanagawae TaxID=293069 RepID=A0ABY2M7I9_9LEPT|nr:hypothetical protein EHQ46_05955 [Leptospira yanagawae]
MGAIAYQLTQVKKEKRELENQNYHQWEKCSLRLAKNGEPYGNLCISASYDECEISKINDIKTQDDYDLRIQNLNIHQLDFPECTAAIEKVRNIYLSLNVQFSFLANAVFNTSAATIESTSLISSCDTNNSFNIGDYDLKMISSSERQMFSDWQMQVAFLDENPYTCSGTLNLNANQTNIISHIRNEAKIIGSRCIFQIGQFQLCN